MVGVPASLCQDETPCAVGIRYVLPTPHRPTPLRILYPADMNDSMKQNCTQVGWFSDPHSGVRAFLEGYGHMALAKHESWTFHLLIRPFVWLLSMVTPLGWLRIPHLYANAPIHRSAENAYPILVFSHGLTGTGQENLNLCKHWAQRGMVVVSVHHTDGSACQVPQAETSERLWYRHGPPYHQYDPTFRPNQVKHRCAEVLEALKLLTTKQVGRGHQNLGIDVAALKDLQEAVDASQVVLAGFSYGASTVAEATVHPDMKCKAAILLDGWFHIDVMKSAGIEFEFPKAAFASPSVQAGQGLPVPSLFLGSTHFENFQKLRQATLRLAGDLHEEDVLPQSGHQNFCDVMFWLPHFFLRRTMGQAMGASDAMETYQSIVQRTMRFLEKHVDFPEGVGGGIEMTNKKAQ